MAHLEIEVKSLLGSQDRTDAVKAKMKVLDPTCTLVSTNNQLNHYFEGGDVRSLFAATKHFFIPEVLEKFEKIVTAGKDFSIRTRQRDDEVFLVIKASIDSGASANAVSRLEFEEMVGVTLSELDSILLESGFQYQAKWSRFREEFTYKDINVCFDKNAGYGYVAEFEKIIHSENDLKETRMHIDHIMAELDVLELDQARLARMFSHYNTNWADYYGTDKTFIIE